MGSRRFYVAMFAATAAIMVIHECAHWLTGEALGYDMWMKLNRAGYLPGQDPLEIHKLLVTAAGPAVTLLIGTAGALICIAKRARWGYLLIFTALMHRAVAMAFSLFGQHNDEARISLALGYPWWLLPSLGVTALLILTIASSRALRLGWGANILSYLAVSAALAAMVALDGELPGQDGLGILAPWLPESAGR